MCRALGLNTVCVYLFWNFHEWQEGKYDSAGQANAPSPATFPPSPPDTKVSTWLTQTDVPAHYQPGATTR